MHTPNNHATANCLAQQIHCHEHSFNSRVYANRVLVILSVSLHALELRTRLFTPLPGTRQSKNDALCTQVCHSTSNSLALGRNSCKHTNQTQPSAQRKQPTAGTNHVKVRRSQRDRPRAAECQGQRPHSKKGEGPLFLIYSPSEGHWISLRQLKMLYTDVRRTTIPSPMHLMNFAPR